LEAIKARFDDLGVALTNPEVVNDNKRFMQISKEYRKLDKIVEVYKAYRNCLDSLDFAREVLETESDRGPEGYGQGRPGEAGGAEGGDGGGNKESADT
jgi:protein subunit release factor A